MSTAAARLRDARRQDLRDDERHPALLLLPLNGDAHLFTAVLEESPKAKDRHGQPPPKCTRGHHGVVRRSGTYDTRAGSKRQSHRCTPGETDLDESSEPAKRHTYPLELPRDHVHACNQDCKLCDELHGVHRGDTATSRLSAVGSQARMSRLPRRFRSE